MLGVDRRPPDSRETQVDGTRSDTMMLVRADPGSGEVKLLSIPRDLLVEVGPGVQDRINAAYAYGGVEQAKAAVENATGVTVDRYAVVSFAGFEEVVDAMGGVEMDVEDELPPKYGIEDGPQTLDGRQALYYARFRGTPDADLGRIERQQRLVAALRKRGPQLGHRRQAARHRQGGQRAHRHGPGSLAGDLPGQDPCEPWPRHGGQLLPARRHARDPDERR